MPDYKNGTPAQKGDLVRGQGYNLKDADGRPRTIVGEVLEVIPGADVCNLRLAVAEVLKPLKGLEPDYSIYRRQDGITIFATFDGNPSSQTVLSIPIRATVEYGQCDHFEKIG